MPTDYISDYTIVDEGDPRVPLTHTIFHTEADAQAWLTERAADLRDAVAAGSITGARLVETRVPARFVATTAEALDYCAFAARVVTTVFVHTVPVLIVGIPREHAAWLCGRLRSGLVAVSGPHDYMEAAVAHAQDALL